ncbi:MAG: hypothetical protein HY926_05625 [Elusimicrobia bacterium]|nr:hypothetical protein [Elusimicrobiota bacterium]
MKVDVKRAGRGFRYALEPERGDPREARRSFADSPDALRLVRREYRVELPPAFTGIHPDAHAAAVWHALRPFVKSRLRLPFAVSGGFAREMRDLHGVAIEPVSRRQPPRRPPGKVVPALLFSGGMDSMAASILLPRRAHHLFLDRIPHRESCPGADALVDLERQRQACACVRRAGSPVHATADDHEHLFSPYPAWHSNMALLSALYMADSLGLSVVDQGEVLDAICFQGYYAGRVSSWRMRPMRARPLRSGPPDLRDFLAAAGLARANCIAGLSEVATTAIVARSRRRGRSYSCYYASGGSFCMRCDKCFKKLLLRHIADGREVPEELFERFLSVPRLAAVFRRPYLDWHHVWYYLFQNLRCRHWFARELSRQARAGPDLSALEKWYPKAIAELEPQYAGEVLSAIQERVGVMTDREAAALEAVEVPPLRAPALRA